MIFNLYLPLYASAITIDFSSSGGAKACLKRVGFVMSEFNTFVPGALSLNSRSRFLILNQGLVALQITTLNAGAHQKSIKNAHP